MRKDLRKMNDKEYWEWIDEVRHDPEFPKIMKEFRRFWDNGGVK
tara:strand:- start:12141 stop:12272 length:132 start_codon:yes stop_codon:yes gene_type:complete